MGAAGPAAPGGARPDAAGDLCEGCFRTLDEIAGWSRMDDEAKRAVWALIERRAGLVEA
ncbi:DUF1289 domain-containing protein [Variovorax terrae]|uniref:DUF1289 domain-containing protein n=1 Tax=Variovorax terrae TaxID=2923278 RepID=A0A9X2AMW8_9BURK|nr:DUF1289 domain-containing protein [Variovorax terrae]MCJ0761752.1 DUF1289 domain-containing protein [Variovorax terrae]